MSRRFVKARLTRCVFNFLSFSVQQPELKTWVRFACFIFSLLSLSISSYLYLIYCLLSWFFFFFYWRFCHLSKVTTSEWLVVQWKHSDSRLTDGSLINTIESLTFQSQDAPSARRPILPPTIRMISSTVCSYKSLCRGSVGWTGPPGLNIRCWAGAGWSVAGLAAHSYAPMGLDWDWVCLSRVEIGWHRVCVGLARGWRGPAYRLSNVQDSRSFWLESRAWWQQTSHQGCGDQPARQRANQPATRPTTSSRPPTARPECTVLFL